MNKKDTHFVRNPDFIFRKVVEETILVPVYQNVADMDAIYTLNEVGAFVWQQMAEPVCIPELEVAILAEFDVDEQTVSTDLASFFQEMEAIGAVKKV